MNNSLHLLPDPSITTGINGLDVAWGILTGFDLAGRDPVIPISTASASTKLTATLATNNFC
jgi:hypothetical protein